jgi:hypothetical protein
MFPHFAKRSSFRILIALTLCFSLLSMLVIFSPASEAARGQEPRGKPRREKPEERAGFRALAGPERPEFVALKPHESLTLTREILLRLIRELTTRRMICTLAITSCTSELVSLV